MSTYVWLLDCTVALGSSNQKLKWPWKGPYTVVDDQHSVYQIQSLNSAGRTRVHCNHLKLCRSRVPEPSAPEHISIPTSIHHEDSDTRASLHWIDDNEAPTMQVVGPHAHLRHNARPPIR